MAINRMNHILDMVKATGDDAPSIEVLVDMLQDFRTGSKKSSKELDDRFIRDIRRLFEGINKAREEQAKLREINEKLTEPPWHLGIFERSAETADGRAIVNYRDARRVVNLAQGVDLCAIMPGEEVYLGAELNVLLGKSPNGFPKSGDTGNFERYMDEGRVLLNARDQEFVVELSGKLLNENLQAGDKILYNRSTNMAYEKLSRTEGREYFLSEVLNIGRNRVGGQDENLEILNSALTQVFLAPEEAQQYGLSGRVSILMIGAPGLGKTLMAKSAASEITRLSGQACRFAVVKPGEWQSPWVGETEANIRNCFRALREAAKTDFVILFLDEIEAIGRIRGAYAGNHHGDRFLAALLAELDGFTDRGNVAVISATNRKDLVDPALLERLSDIEIQVARPDLRGARAIFEIHMPPSLPYNSNGASAAATRKEIIETAVSRFYTPNADNELCELRLRDGTVKMVTARELVSGRIFEQVCRAARQAAFIRKIVQGKDSGLCVSDIEKAVSDRMDRLRTLLTPGNVHAYLQDLPETSDVVEVNPIVRKVKQPNRYLILNTD